MECVSESMTTRLLGIFGFLLLITSGCAADTSEEATDEESDELKDEGRGVSGNKICVKVKNETELHITAGGPNLVVPQKLTRGHFVLVQRLPGRVGNRVWVDPDLYGLRGDADRKNLAKRCGISLEAAKHATERAIVGRRGWVDVDDLTGNLEKVLGPNQPDGPALQAKDLKNGKPRSDKPMHIAGTCAVEGAYRGSSASNPAGFRTYGTNGFPFIYVSYGTTDIDGGGVTFGWIPTHTQVYWLEDNVQDQSGEHCQVDKTEKVCNADAAPGNHAPKVVWSAVWAKQGSRTLHGWVPKACLVP
jgi:hypothetical protein